MQPDTFFCVLWLNPAKMLKNYLLIATRSLYKNLGYTSINIFGLAIGITTCLIIMLFVNNEISYDRFLLPVLDLMPHITIKVTLAE